MYEILQAGMKVWENDAKETRRLQLALNYLEIAPVKHTGNRWVEDEKGVRSISNAVYKMTCHLSEHINWNLWKPGSSLKDRWQVEWSVIINTPLPHQYCSIAGQIRKFADKENAEHYLDGRIRAYSKLFTEIYPPVPYDKRQFFMESGLVLPGYHIEDSENIQNKDYVLGKLSEAKAQQKSAPAQSSKKKNEPEI